MCMYKMHDVQAVSEEPEVKHHHAALAIGQRPAAPNSDKASLGKMVAYLKVLPRELVWSGVLLCLHM